MKTRNLGLYFLVLSVLFFIVITALGGGVFNQTFPPPLQWQHQLFAGFCHQDPARSLWINRQPMAVCSRCFGVYTGFAIGWIILPVFSLVAQDVSRLSRKIALSVIILNILDVVGNMLGFWQNTLVSRLVLGWLLGWTVVLLFTGDFFKITDKSNKESLWKKHSNKPRIQPHHIGHQ